MQGETNRLPRSSTCCTKRQWRPPYAALSVSGLNLGASATIGIYVLPPLLASAFGKNASNPPLVKIRNTAEIAAAVANFELDLGFIEGPCTDAALDVAPWRTDALLAVGAPDHPLALQSADARHAR